MKYHPVIEMLGVHRFKSAELTDAFLKEIRLFNKKNDFESGESGPYLGDDAKQSNFNQGQNSDDIAVSSKSNKVGQDVPEVGLVSAKSSKTNSGLA